MQLAYNTNDSIQGFSIEFYSKRRLIKMHRKAYKQAMSPFAWSAALFYAYALLFQQGGNHPQSASGPVLHMFAHLRITATKLGLLLKETTTPEFSGVFDCSTTCRS